LIERISAVYKRMAHAAMRAGREPDVVRLIAVTKTVPAGLMREAYEAGLRDFGESRLQEAAPKLKELGELGGLEGLRLHMIGHLQSNKARLAVAGFDLIHSIDSASLLMHIDRHALEAGKVQSVLLQVKVSEEVSKHGAEEAELGRMIEAAGVLRGVKVEGLMCIPPYFDEPARARPYFARLRGLAESYGLRELSMGMTGDFEVAIEEGSTMVRVGTAIFGERGYL